MDDKMPEEIWLKGNWIQVDRKAFIECYVIENLSMQKYIRADLVSQPASVGDASKRIDEISEEICSIVFNPRLEISVVRKRVRVLSIELSEIAAAPAPTANFSDWAQKHADTLHTLLQQAAQQGKDCPACHGDALVCADTPDRHCQDMHDEGDGGGGKDD